MISIKVIFHVSIQIFSLRLHLETAVDSTACGIQCVSWVDIFGCSDGDKRERAHSFNGKSHQSSNSFPLVFKIVKIADFFSKNFPHQTSDWDISMDYFSFYTEMSP